MHNHQGKPQEKTRAQGGKWPLQAEKPKQNLPEQKPLTEEEEIDTVPPAWKGVVRKILFALLAVVLVIFVYLFLLLGEPDDDAQKLESAKEEKITMSISPLEVPGESDPVNLAQSFQYPVLSLYPGVLPMERSRIYDTAYEGGFARRVTFTYTLSGGETLYVESIRPTGAATLWKNGEFTLDGSKLYAVGGVDAAWMENSESICVFGQTENAAYCVICPAAYREELPQLLRSTLLTAPAAQE